ncbi:MAG: DUF2782 domain-containing protein [Burkholderiales bacterium]
MRRTALILLCVAATCAASAALAQNRPPKLEPLPEAPPPTVRDGADEPRVRIAPQAGDKVEEVRDGGRVTMIKVTPPNGIPYYLTDPTSDGTWQRNSTDPRLRPPMWTIWTFD